MFLLNVCEPLKLELVVELNIHVCAIAFHVFHLSGC